MFMSCSCHVHVMFMSCSCHVHVMFISCLTSSIQISNESTLGCIYVCICINILYYRRISASQLSQPHLLGMRWFDDSLLLGANTVLLSLDWFRLVWVGMRSGVCLGRGYRTIAFPPAWLQLMRRHTQLQCAIWVAAAPAAFPQFPLLQVRLVWKEPHLIIWNHLETSCLSEPLFVSGVSTWCAAADSNQKRHVLCRDNLAKPQRKYQS